MNIHEHQAKGLLKQFGISVPDNRLVSDVSEVKTACDELKTNTWVVKAQIHAGARGKGGGVVVCHDVKAVKEASNRLIGQALITPQTDDKGLLVSQVLIEAGQDIAQELYLSFLLDRQTKQVVMVASTAGGMDIEQTAKDNPSAILTVQINPCLGLLNHQVRQLAFKLALTPALFKQFVVLCKQAYILFIQKDLSLLEINPLIITKDNQLLALDAKIVCEDNALYRQSSLLRLSDKTQINHYEQVAKEQQLSYIALEGSIGCMVNGAGLAMATMDLIDYYGGSPANFLDVGGSTTAERVAKALNIILSSDAVKVILINIFGGIVRCDLIAQGIIDATKEVKIVVPIVVRLAGTNAKKGLDMLANSNLDIHSEPDLVLATKKAVVLAQ